MRAASARAPSLLAELDAAFTPALRNGEPGALLRRVGENLAGPLRVAIVGQIKTGKSTLMNALLGEALLPTGVEETTYNINWLRYGPEPRAVIRWLDGTPPRDIAIDEVAGWTKRLGAPASATGVRYLDIFTPNPILQRVELIDTPGLASSHGIDSEKTEAFLRIADEVSEQEASDADAVVFVFRRGVHESDEQALRAFRKAAEGRVSPLNAIGVLAQIDQYWPAADNPKDAANRIIESLKSKEQIRTAFYDVLPISALLAAGPHSLDKSGRDALAALASMDDDAFRRITMSVARFVSAEEDAAQGRQRLIEALGLYGVVRVRALAKEVGVAEALERLKIESGVPALQTLLERHFGNRALLIKLLYALIELRRVAARMSDAGDAGARQCAEHWRAAIESFVFGTPEVLRLDLVRAAYAPNSDLSSGEIEEILAAAGEFGEDTGSRFRTDAPLAEHLARRIGYWRARANEASALAARSELAARSMCRLLEQAHQQTGAP